MSIDIVSLPIIGAFIGYFTNYVAIKMLFYPKKAYYIKGIRVPFTPGLIPKKRDELIDKISNVVAEKVINKRDLTKYIYSKKNREFLYSYSKNIIDDLLNRKLSTLNLPYRTLEKYINTQIDTAIKKYLKEKILQFNIDFDYITYNAFLLIDKNQTIKDVLGADAINHIKMQVELIARKSLNNLAESLDDEKTKDLIKRKITESLNEYIDESNILTASFVSMIAPMIEENDKIIDLIVDKLKKFIRDKTIQEKVNKSILDSMETEIFNLRLEEFTIKFTNNNLEQIRQKLSEKLANVFDKLNLKEKIATEIINTLDTKKLSRRAVAYIRLNLNRYSFKDALEFLKPGFYKKINRFIINNLLILIKRESDRIFDFDISENARKKLEALDIGQIEDIVLNISKEQFKYINLFGGILGFLIGIIEVILR